MSEPQASPTEAAGHSIVAEISREIVKAHVKFFGRGPTKAKTIWREDVVAVVLEEIFTTAEQTLMEAGQFEHVRTHRQTFQDEIEPLFREIVERSTGRRVRAFFSQVNPDGIAVEIFLLEPEPA
jgi:uncharacterized protein YbcI